MAGLSFDEFAGTPKPLSFAEFTSAPEPSKAERAGMAVGDFLDRTLPQNATARDVIQSTASAVPKVGATLMGLPASALNAFTELAPSQTAGPRSIAFTPLQNAVRLLAGQLHQATGKGTPTQFPGGVGDMQASASDLGLVHQPQTMPGKFAGTMAEFALPGGLLGGLRGGLLGLTGGAGSEAGGQLTEGTPAEPWARLSGGLLGTGLPALLPTTNAGRMLNLRMQGLSDKEIQLARDRIAEGERLGIKLSPAEALDSRPMQALASTTAQTETGGMQAGRFMDQRAETLPGIIRDKIAPEISSSTPEMTAVGARSAMSNLGDRARTAGYAAADTQTLDRVAIQPVIERVAKAWEMAPVEAKPILARLYRNLTEANGSVSRIDEAWKVAKASVAPPAGVLEPLAKAKHESLVRSLSRSGIIDDIEGALRTNVDYRRGLDLYGKEAKAGQLMRQADDVLESASDPTQAGPTRMAGVNFRNEVLRGPGSQAEEATRKTIMEAARRAGRDPDEAWRAAQKVFDVLDRTGRIPGSGSPTFGRGTASAEAANTGALGVVSGASVAQPLNFLDRMLANTVQRKAFRELGNLFYGKNGQGPSTEAIDIMLRMARMNDTSAAMLLPSLLNAGASSAERRAQ